MWFRVIPEFYVEQKKTRNLMSRFELKEKKNDQKINQQFYYFDKLV